MLSDHGGDFSANRKAWGEPQTEIVDYSVNLNLFAPDIPAHSWQKWLQGVSTYPPQDASAIEKRLAEIYRIPAEQIVVTNGAMEALEASLRLFQNQRVYVPTPCFNEYLHLAEMAGCDVQALEQQTANWQQLDFLHRIARNSVVVLGNPGNPTGYLIPEKLLRDAMIQRPDVTWIVDEAFIEFTETPATNSLIHAIPENCIVLRSLTKLWSIPGIRIGFLATGNRTWLSTVRKRLRTWHMGWVAHAWSEEFLTPACYASLMKEMKAYTGLRREFRQRLRQLQNVKVYPSETNYLLLETQGTSALKLAEELWKKGFAVRTMQGIPGMDIQKYLRICILSQETNQSFTQTLATILNRS